MPLPINWDADAAAGWLARQGEAARRLARMLGLEIGGRRHG
jgi:hypothetical protein